jgi:organic hydroperoxide reductase OsmC/OhrA
MPVYKNKVEWRGEHKGYTWCQNGIEMDFSAPPALFGLLNTLTPEDAFVAAANTCYHMMVIWAIERFKVNLVSFSCEAAGEVEELIDRTSWFKRVTLSPEIVVEGTPKEVVQRALEMALKYSTICQSLKSELLLKPTIIVR